MAILQIYQAEVLKKMDEGGGVTPKDVKELRRATDLALCATKHTAWAVGHSMAGLVTAERHLWLNLTEKEKALLGVCGISFPIFCNWTIEWDSQILTSMSQVDKSNPVRIGL